MGQCLCLEGKSGQSSDILIKEEHKRFLLNFENKLPSLKKEKKSKKMNNNDNTKPKSTPACLLFSNEDSPMLPQDNEKKKSPSFENFNIIKMIGKGSYGRVFLVEKKDSGKVYAMKALRKEEVEKRNQKFNTKTERNILGKMNSPFLVKLKYAFQNSEKLYMVMEFMRGGELFYHLKKLNHFDEAIARFYLAEIILALEYLHKNNIVYRDLKPENILLDEFGHIKLADFGISKEGVSYGDKTYTFCGTPEYLAPEILLGEGHDKSVDWWSLGVLLYEMLTGNTPFENKDKMRLYDSILNKPLEMKPFFSVEAASILQALICVKPNKRLGSSSEDAQEIKKHCFFSNVAWDWESAAQRTIPTPFKPELGGIIDLKYFDEKITNEIPKDSPIYTKFGVRYEIYSNYTYMRRGGSDFNSSTFLKN